MLKEFRDFIARGNVMDLAVGIIIGAAFTAIVTSLVNDLINPLIGAIVGGHLLGIVAAHEKAVSLLEPRSALAGQWPMLVVMVGYTCAGLVLLFSP